ncbi:MAG: Asp-tRNA(Asn)/Glu-tRNA(Gln) amidotransferase subunit GatA [Planctomycetota bacterium]|nr:Asp-tRNA(Asn)/Glu-tRNA(Gln) amidotransferase subunit GatA [Planctomycetota bacterium]
MTHPLDLSVAEMAARVNDPGDDLTARTLVDEALRRIEVLDARVKAFLVVTPELAREQADAVDAKVAAGERAGPLAGVPLAVKDNLAVPGVPLTCGSKILGEYVPPTWATCVERAVAAGCCIVGKTNLDEFAMGSSTENSAFGPSRNPYDLERVPGGSSGGSAAAVASGMVPLAFGSDTGGSIRQPAALCGIVGIKPSYGRVSRNGLVAFASSLDQPGPFARSVDDAATLLKAMAGVDPLDATSYPFEHEVVDHGEAPASGEVLGDLRIGRVTEFGLQQEGADCAARDLVEATCTTLVEKGAEQHEIAMPVAAQGIPIYYLVAPAEASSNLARYDGVRYGHRTDDAGSLIEMYAKTRDEGFGAEVKRRILLGTFALSAGYADAYYKQAMASRAALRDAFRAAFETVDVIISATTPSPAFRLGEKVDDPLEMYLCDVLTVAANLSGVPAMSIPVGQDERGLPLGLQIWAPLGREDVMLAVAREMEQVAGCRYTPPALAAEVMS